MILMMMLLRMMTPMIMMMINAVCLELVRLQNYENRCHKFTLTAADDVIIL